MCGRYSLAPGESREIMDIIRQVQGDFKTGEIFPADPVPVLMEAGEELAPEVMVWGYPGVGGKGRPIINARSETAAQKPMFKDGMRQRRCVIPASHYFEWERRGAARTKYAIRPARADTLYLAGIYHLENYDGVIVPAFTILTRDAASGIVFIHPRMPVLLPADAAPDWLNPGYNAEEVIAAALTDMEYQSA